MHIPPQFSQQDPSQLVALIKQYPLANVVCVIEQGLCAHHLPLYLAESQETTVLRGHIAKANDMWKVVADKSQVLAIFQGPQAYITPNYYPTKQQHGKAVPTWNYVAVHIKGSLRFIDDSSYKYEVVDRLTHHMEAEEAKPWQLSDAPDEYIERMLTGIVGIEIVVEAMEGQFKLSQNQPEVNQQGVVNGLSASTQHDLQEMAQWVSNAND